VTPFQRVSIGGTLRSVVGPDWIGAVAGALFVRLDWHVALRSTELADDSAAELARVPRQARALAGTQS